MIGRREFLKTGIGVMLASCTNPLGHGAIAERGDGMSSTGSHGRQEPGADSGQGYRHDYHQSLVYKVMIGGKGSASFLQLEEALEIVKQTSGFTRGIQQIVYLVGWQFDGHDSKYPAWSEVNPRIKRPCDSSARTSLIWFMKEARKHNAIVSLHINMTDAYENSPLWKQYLENDLLLKEADGTLRKGGVWGGEQAYQVCKTREWKSGYAKKRIDSLLELLPIIDAGTIHIDAFVAIDSPGHKITEEDELDAMAEMLKYWRSRRVDVTIEDMNYRFAGLIPMVWHYNLEERARLMYPPQTLCGGGSMWNARLGSGLKALHPQPFRPESGCLYEQAWGQSVDRDVSGLGAVGVLAEQFYLKTLPWQFLNQSRPLKLVQDAETYSVQFQNGARTSVRYSDGHFLLRQAGRTYVDGTDLFVPAMWLEKECIAYSLTGCRRNWQVPPEWGNVAELSVTQLWPLGSHQPRLVGVHGGSFDLELTPKQAFLVRPAP